LSRGRRDIGEIKVRSLGGRDYRAAARARIHEHADAKSRTVYRGRHHQSAHVSLHLTPPHSPVVRKELRKKTASLWPPPDFNWAFSR